ncbi:MAG: adventurous gliding motility protein CglF [Anaeromyxobacter sp.]
MIPGAARGRLTGLAGRVVSSPEDEGSTMRKILLMAALALPLGAAAQTPPPAPPADAPPAKVEYEKKTVINFEDDTIEGDLKRPDGEYVEARRKVDHSNLIKIRENWRDKVMQSSGDL